MVPDDDEQMRSLFFGHYFTRCTICRLLDIKVPDECTRMVDRLSSVSADGWSVVAQEPESKTLIGVAIAYLVDFDTDDTTMPYPLSVSATEKEKIFADFMDNHLQYLYKGKAKGWFVRHKVERFVKGYQGTVHKDFCGKGIAKGMILQLTQNALERGVQCFVGEAGNPIARRAMEVKGFEELSKLFVADYKHKGELLFRDCGDASMTLMGKVLRESNLQ